MYFPNGSFEVWFIKTGGRWRKLPLNQRHLEAISRKYRVFQGDGSDDIPVSPVLLISVIFVGTFSDACSV